MLGLSPDPPSREDSMEALAALVSPTPTGDTDTVVTPFAPEPQSVAV